MIFGKNTAASEVWWWASGARTLPQSLEPFPLGAAGGWWAGKLSRWREFAGFWYIFFWKLKITPHDYIFHTHV